MIITASIKYDNVESSEHLANLEKHVTLFYENYNIGKPGNGNAPRLRISSIDTGAETIKIKPDEYESTGIVVGARKENEGWVRSMRPDGVAISIGSVQYSIGFRHEEKKKK